MAVTDQDRLATPVSGESTSGGPKRLAVDDDGKLLLPAGSVILGKVGIDQTTPGTTNLVATSVVKTIQTELLAITAVVADTVQKSSELALTGIKQVTVFIDHGRTATTAFVAKGTQYLVEVSQKATGNDAWVPLAVMEADITTAVATTADDAEAAGQTVIECDANYPAIDDFVFWENATLSLSEWGRVVARVTGADSESFTLEDGLTNAQAVAKKIYNKAHRWALIFPVGSYTRLRVVVNNAGGTTNVAIKARVAAITEV